MTEVSIRAEALRKRYRIGLEETREETLAGLLGSWIKSPISKFRHLRRLSRFDDDDEGEDIIWALDGVSFEIRAGEVVGIIGRNGAGKTTLLKVLSRITEPTYGRAVMHGRVASLISVGTGFHGELTGRENVFLNGTILGMSKQEIARKFDEIVAFSGVEKFIDTPVKRYSSGMHVRLGFAVAAHLEPDILLVDEVLAVGDAAFQKKCLGKMEDVAQEGRTVVFISHNMQLVDMLCPRTILLEGGRVAADGPTGRVIEHYLEKIATTEVGAETSVEDSTHRRGSGKVRFTSVTFRNGAGQEQYRFRRGESVRFELSYRVNEPVDGLLLRFVVGAGKSRETLGVIREVVTLDRLEAGDEDTLILDLPSIPFNPGIYPLRFEVRSPEPKSDDFDQRVSYDVLHDLTSPLVVYSDDEDRDHGVIDLEVRLVRAQSLAV